MGKPNWMDFGAGYTAGADSTAGPDSGLESAPIPAQLRIEVTSEFGKNLSCDLSAER